MRGGGRGGGVSAVVAEAGRGAALSGLSRADFTSTKVPFAPHHLLLVQKVPFAPCHLCQGRAERCFRDCLAPAA